MNEEITIVKASADSEEVKKLISKLNAHLKSVTGRDGTYNFKINDTENEKSVFLMAYYLGEPYGCSALRPISDDTAEIKRMYANPNKVGIGSAIIKALEDKARDFGYAHIKLETGIQNVEAIRFYKKNGYVHCETYGVYQGRDDVYCFEKKL